MWVCTPEVPCLDGPAPDPPATVCLGHTMINTMRYDGMAEGEAYLVVSPTGDVVPIFVFSAGAEGEVAI